MPVGNTEYDDAGLKCVHGYVSFPPSDVLRRDLMQALQIWDRQEGAQDARLGAGLVIVAYPSVVQGMLDLNLIKWGNEIEVRYALVKDRPARFFLEARVVKDHTLGVDIWRVERDSGQADSVLPSTTGRVDHGDAVKLVDPQDRPVYVPSPASDNSDEFVKALGETINRFSKENGSNTPDFILANYLRGCLTNFDAAVNRREDYYGDEVPGVPVEPAETLDGRPADKSVWPFLAAANTADVRKPYQPGELLEAFISLYDPPNDNSVPLPPEIQDQITEMSLIHLAEKHGSPELQDAVRRLYEKRDHNSIPWAPEIPSHERSMDMMDRENAEIKRVVLEYEADHGALAPEVVADVVGELWEGRASTVPEALAEIDKEKKRDEISSVFLEEAAKSDPEHVLTRNPELEALLGATPSDLRMYASAMLYAEMRTLLSEMREQANRPGVSCYALSMAIRSAESAYRRLGEMTPKPPFKPWNSKPE